MDETLIKRLASTILQPLRRAAVPIEIYDEVYDNVVDALLGADARGMRAGAES